MIRPLVSIGIPTRNRARCLAATLENVLAIDFEPLEIVISDNASEDETERVCRTVEAADSRVRYVRHARNIGLHGNHNFCMDTARGDLLCICHDHDQRSPDIVREYVQFLEAHPEVGLVCSDWDLIDDDGHRIGVRDHDVPDVTPGLEYIDRTIRSGRSAIGIPGAMVRREALGDARFHEDAPIGFGDFPLWSRVAETWAVGHVPKRLWSWRQNRDSHSARPIESIVHDYELNLGRYCDEHLERWPDHVGAVEEWRRAIDRYLFWALMYEVSLHYRPNTRRRLDSSGGSTLFEIMDYRLTDEQLQRVFSEMRRHRSGPVEHVAYAGVRSMVGLRVTWPLGFASRFHGHLRGILGLR